MKKLILILALIILLPVSAWADSVTFELGNSVDDTYGANGSLGYNGNEVTGNDVNFGQFYLASNNWDERAYFRWVLTIPKCSKISSSNISLQASGAHTAAFTSNIHYLTISGSPAWRGANGFAVANYANGTALNAISESTATVSWSPAAQSLNTWYDTPNISTLLQSTIDNPTDYDPANTTNKYIGFKIDEGNGAYAADKWRQEYSYNSGAANAAELDVTWTNRSAANFGNYWQVRDGVVSYRGY
jgi:hypothetical protein